MKRIPALVLVCTVWQTDAADVQRMVSTEEGDVNIPVERTLTAAEGGSEISTGQAIWKAVIVLTRQNAYALEQLRSRSQAPTGISIGGAAVASETLVASEAAVAAAASAPQAAGAPKAPFTVAGTGIVDYSDETGWQGWWCPSGWTFTRLKEVAKDLIAYACRCADGRIPYQ